MGNGVFKECFDKNAASFGDLTPDEIARAEAEFTAKVVEGRKSRLTLEDAIAVAKDRIKAPVKLDRQRQQYKAVLQIAAISRAQEAVVANVATHKNVAETLMRKVVHFADGKSNVTASTVYEAGVIQDINRTMSGVADVFGKFFGGISKEGTQAMVQFAFGKNSGNAAADSAMKAMFDILEKTRVQANKLGANIKKVSERYLPQSEDWRKLQGKQEAYVKFLMGRVDRARMLNEDGTSKSDAQLDQMLRAIWTTKVTEGSNKATSGVGSGGAIANRGSAQRELHFKDAQAWLDYHAEFGGDALWDMLQGHFSAQARNIGLMQALGPNPNTTVDAVLNLERKRLKDASNAGDAKAADSLRSLDRTADKLAKVLGYQTGASRSIGSEAMAAGFATARAIQGWLLMGSLMSSFTDMNTATAAARYNGFSGFDLWQKRLARMNPLNKGEKVAIQNAGLMSSVALEHMQNFGENLTKFNWAQRIGNLGQKIQGMDLVTRQRREAYSAMMANSIGHLVDTKNLSDLHPNDARYIKGYGITDQDWAIWGAAKKLDYGNGEKILGIDGLDGVSDTAIRKIVGDGDVAKARDEAKQKFLGMIASEAKLAVYEPSQKIRAEMYGGIKKGTLGGEIAASLLQFKSFPWGYGKELLFERYGRQGGATATKYVGGLLLANTVVGAAIVTAKDMLAGKTPPPFADPEDENFGKAWLRAFTQGGGVGLLGDALFGERSVNGWGTVGAMAGPLAGAVVSAFEIALKARDSLAAGEAPDIGAGAVRLASGYVPGSSLWYMKGLYNHAIVQNAQEAMNPGYLDRMESKLKTRTSQEYWWHPGLAVPDEAPNIDTLTGE